MEIPRREHALSCRTRTMKSDMYMSSERNITLGERLHSPVSSVMNITNGYFLKNIPSGTMSGVYPSSDVHQLQKFTFCRDILAKEIPQILSSEQEE